MNPIFSSIEIFNVKFEKVAHDVIEHKKASSFLDGAFLSVVHEIKDWSQDFVHSLDVLCPWVHFSKDKQDSSHVIVPIGPAMLCFTAIPEL